MTDQTMDPAPAEPQGQALAFSTTIKPSNFLGLSLKNGLLNLITLTLYRFWGKTEVRQRVWRGVRLNDEAFEYTGRGMELFIGFLLAALFLGVPFLTLGFLVQFFGPMVILFAYVPMYFFLLWLWGFGIYSAFRYMASRTTWRGVRFQVKGSAADYGIQYIGHLLLSGITFGWWWPTAERKMAEQIWDDVRFGDRRLRFSMGRAESEGVFGPYAIGWVGSIVGYIALAAISFGLGSALGEPTGADQGPLEPDIASTLMIYAVLLALSPLILLIWAPYQAAMLRSIAAGISLEGARFKLKVNAIPLWWLTLTNLFFLLISFGFLMPWVQARAARFLVERLESIGTAQLDEAMQAGRGPKSGEGLADALGFSSI